ncbi:alanine--tRNA ligase [Candidatus Contubernalis alkaliaceticus]|uniref:alanine--tRNA ligase n=1 Tax=Candidatus Contubernalis alkaliaceticus TaxID=338645 RepID=UPI001F4BD351|nr:alanine--tRNA ligase [Candidatus Contubernalis alkalaceticus]UNC92592.1 alanine--tRNA ligase [Candidatus Contubernalis alkalaceticus]
MKTKEIREKFLNFFKNKDHLVLPSYSLIPQDDPTLLLIGAGMAPLKPYFTGEKKPPHPRVTTCQKCVRTPDIERVGKTARHATFFEMLGNFSFGDYFKEEAIQWAWELVTEVYHLPEKKLYVSVYQEDDEAYDIWHKIMGLPESKIFRLGKEDNFWEIGQGPCGPCSEIYYDLGFEFGCGRPDCQVGCDCDRFVEIWNLVFTQFNCDSGGSYLPLSQKNIDTGAGLERMAMALQNVPTFYEIDIIKPILDYFVRLTGVRYGENSREDISLRILTEHLRSLTFMVVDGIQPSNEGRGYVLRRMIRRAVRHGRLLGLEDLFLFEAVPMICEVMGDVYQELKEREDYIVKVVQLEEERFRETLEQGLTMLSTYLIDLQRDGEKELPGDVAFKLYDTFGFPLDLTREILEEKGLGVDEKGFKVQLELQRERARSAREKMDAGEAKANLEPFKDQRVEFIGFDTLETKSRIAAIYNGDVIVDKAEEGQEVTLILDKTPFYAESGGQVGDQGTITTESALVEIQDTKLGTYDLFLHRARVIRGEIYTGEKVKALVDSNKRGLICRNHTVTHLLHRALKEVLGEHVNQAGSLVAPQRLRFDFTHFASLSQDEVKKIEEIVNKHIWKNLKVDTQETTLQAARESGAMALFEGKYEDKVRMVSIDNYSLELCGGTHVKHTGDIGLFKILSESGIGTGLRRIEALSGPGAYHYLSEKEEILTRGSVALKTKEENFLPRLETLIQSYNEMVKENQNLRSKLASQKVDELLDKAVQVKGVPVLAAQVNVTEMEQLRSMADQLKDKMGSGVVVLGSVKGEKVLLVAAVTADLVKKGLHAGKIVGEAAKQTGGGGGGRPDMAQAGGKEKDKLPSALKQAAVMVEKLMV